MKWSFYIALPLFFICSLASAQRFSKVDRHALKAPKKISKNIHKLTQYLTEDYTTDLEKVRSIYIWITHNIKYDQSAYKKNRRRVNKSNADVLDRRQAVCFGYSTLFNEMCSITDIKSEIVYGYPKNVETGFVDMTTTSHAWNAVLIDSTWHLLDITWASGNNRAGLENYFLVSPEKMIASHLPADPMWQLLNSPVPGGIFRKDKNYIIAFLKSGAPSFNFKDSIQCYLKLPPIQKRLKTTKNMCLFNPVKENEEELGHTYLDYVSILLDRADALEQTDSLAAIKATHLEIIATCEMAERYVDLYDHQKENLAYAHMNYAIALSKSITEAQDQGECLKTMSEHFEKAKAILLTLPSNILLENALIRLDDYIKWVEEY